MKGLKFFNKDKIAIDLGSYETKIIGGRQENDGLAIKKAFSFITPPNSYENGYIKDDFALTNAVKEELRANNISGSSCHLTVKSTDILSREIVFPVLSDKEIESTLKYQMAEYFPTDFSRYIVQHKVLEKVVVDGKEKLNILVLGMPSEMVEAYYSFIKELGLKPDSLDYQSNSLSKLLNYAGTINKTMIPSEKTIAAVDLGHYSTNINIISKGNGKVSRVIESGGEKIDRNAYDLITMDFHELMQFKQEIKDISILEEDYSDYNRYANIVKTSLESLIDKIDKVFRFYDNKETENQIEEILLYGGLSGVKGVEKLFSNYFAVPSVILSSANRIKTSEDINKYVNCIGAIIAADGV